MSTPIVCPARAALSRVLLSWPVVSQEFPQEDLSDRGVAKKILSCDNGLLHRPCACEAGGQVVTHGQSSRIEAFWKTTVENDVHALQCSH